MKKNHLILLFLLFMGGLLLAVPLSSTLRSQNERATEQMVVEDQDGDGPESTPEVTPQAHVNTPPQQLVIPKLGLVVSVEKVGLDEKNRMDVPQDYMQVAWYEYGPNPGEMGSSVIAGHLDSPTGPAIFYELNQLQLGDEVTTIGEDGVELQFVVVEKQVFSDESFPIAEVFQRADARRLNLITCTGTFDKAEKNYSDRLVVFTQVKSSL